MTQIEIDAVKKAIEFILPHKIFDLYYGESGSGKSDAIYWVIRQALKENPGKKAKLIIGDGSAASYAPLIKAGVAEMCEYVQRPWPLDVMNKLCDGWWLKDRQNPLSPLVPPMASTLNEFCITVIEGYTVSGKYIMGSVKGGMAQQAASGIQMGPDAVVTIRMGEYDKGELKDGPGTEFGTNGTAHYMAPCTLR